MDAMGSGTFPRTNVASGPKKLGSRRYLWADVVFAWKLPRHAGIGQYGLHRPKSSTERANSPQFSLEPSNIRRARAFTSFNAEPRMHYLSRIFLIQLENF